ncbi:hypothetical protein GNZ12_16270 [Paraburkholderia sp. 1N]|uniref:Alanine dehydrogenase/pyridine nucleotide transhydrogenase N-terminal domain-containing protein n=1 Tax=Paraburkholderia solitsugae TaxID=2675748 RepID=A0ABX2BSC6_9BURK|nr:hypothetical protein [Paraburkholderia solitsugae]
MILGVPTETAPDEARVAVTAETAKKLVDQGHTVRVQTGCWPKPKYLMTRYSK